MADGKITKKEIIEINGLHKLIVEAEKGTLEHALKVGALLKKAKDAVGHGGWLQWLEENCPTITDRTARTYMRLAQPKNETKIESAAAANRKRVSDLSIREANRMLAPERTEEQKAKAKAAKEARKVAPETTGEAVKKYIESLSADDLAAILFDVFDTDYLNSLVEQLAGEADEVEGTPPPTEGEPEHMRRI